MDSVTKNGDEDVGGNDILTLGELSERRPVKQTLEIKSEIARIKESFPIFVEIGTC